MKQDKKSSLDSLRKSTRKFKRRRRELTSKKISRNVLKEKKEGMSYKTDIGLNLDVSLPQPQHHQQQQQEDQHQQQQVINNLKVLARWHKL